MIQTFLQPLDIEEALTLRRNHPTSAWYAGGTEINRLRTTLSPETVISLEKLKLAEISAEKTAVRIGAMATFTDLLENPLIPAWLKEAAAYCGSFARRNRATIGGNLALMSEHSFLAPALLASEALLVTANLTEGGFYNEDRVPIAEYFAHRSTHAGTLVLALIIPTDRFVGSQRFALSVQNYSAVNVGFGAKAGKNITDVRVFVALSGSGVVRLESVERAIEAGEAGNAEQVRQAVSSAVKPVDDITGSAAYKAYIAGEAIGQLYAEFLKGGV